ncbi:MULTISPECIES: hypothetical protein [Jonquetella]|uniref:CobQ/CobB/MinD/ParA nucleotide binding domain-containing protein n=1 Tax=Jonquetella anthropi DSM 22815 TaxID=885272 RepID=H0UM03_9BACT|nr:MULTISPECIES: hypothetical protein [Jonquetella]EEX47564.1 hypothetical protein GCWU000246_01698 [Jonquetella anthropi E3_33 E1]EHM12545.1 hypothetical protein JonanDRAFT_0114 [Jonquetella anthropi DSM 22815]ERL24678.1 hypothetical protein HMPREF1249_1252 [Jonquetella sp. BV3C21]
MRTDDREELRRLMGMYEWPKSVAVTGALGSGKTEWVLNLSAGFRALGDDVTVADADIINPYFCIRQVTEALEAEGFQVLTAPGQAKWSDMPVVTSEVDRVLSAPGKRVLLDIGGDAEGALALKQYQLRLRQAGFLLILVVNSFRPQTSTLDSIRVMKSRMEAIGSLEVGALVSNSHVMTETTPEDVYSGWQLVEEASQAFGLPLLYCSTRPSIHEETVKLFQKKGVKTPLWQLSRHMLLPWEPGAIWGTGLPAKNHGHRMLQTYEYNRSKQGSEE